MCTLLQRDNHTNTSSFSDASKFGMEVNKLIRHKYTAPFKKPLSEVPLTDRQTKPSAGCE